MFDWLPGKIEQAYQIFQEFSLDWIFIFNPPATIDEIQSCEMNLGVPLPPSYREFLLLYNGARLFCSGIGDSEGDDLGLIIQGTDNLIEFNHKKNAGMYLDEEWNSLIAFCDLEIVGTGDFCGLDPQKKVNSEYAVLDCFHEITPTNWRENSIASSFEEWLEKIFDEVIVYKKSPVYWFEITSSLAEETTTALNRQGIRKAQNDNYIEAIDNFNQVILLDPTNHKAYYERGNVYFLLNNYREAIKDFTYAIRFCPHSVIAYNKRGLTRFQLEDYEGAIADFGQALEKNSRSAEIYNNRANARSRLGDIQGAMEDRQKATEINEEELYSDGEEYEEEYELYSEYRSHI